MRLLQGSRHNTTTASSNRRGSQVFRVSLLDLPLDHCCWVLTCPSPAAAWLRLASPHLLMKTWLLSALCRSGRRARCREFRSESDHKGRAKEQGARADKDM